MCVLRGEMLQNLLVVTVVDVVAVDLKDDLARLKTRPCRLPACSVSTQDQRSKVRSHRAAEIQWNYIQHIENMKCKVQPKTCVSLIRGKIYKILTSK